MKKTGEMIVQIGKNGVTDGTIQLLQTAFKDRERIKVVLLKGAGHTKEKTREAAEKIVESLGKNYTYRTLGFTIFLQKWRKPRNEAR